jgi:glycosyltransferase involved in cell wall biosynthesis
MISIFTPSHDPKYLDKCYESLVAQTVKDWEWIVVLNGNAKWKKPKDERVVTYRCEGGRGVGYYKAEAVNWCTGDICLELDHDDLLEPEALERVQEAFDQADDITFVYSDFMQINEDGSPNFDEFDLNHGWSYRDEDGSHICNGFPPYPHNLGYIWYAPNHLRAFRKDAYSLAGGYDRSLYVLDDQELMSRLFLTGEFYQIREGLYKQRIHSEQTQAQAETNASIQTGTVDLYNETIERMALFWAARRGLKCLDLGAAHNKPKAYLGVDIYPGPDVHYVSDFLKLDLPPNSVGVIRAVDFLEHVPDKIAVMNKIWELLAHGGMLLSLTPSTDGRGAWQDPTHVAGWNENSFWYFTDDNYRRFVPTVEAKFHPSRVVTYFPSDWHKAHNISYVQANLVAVKKDSRDFGGTPWY